MDVLHIFFVSIWPVFGRIFPTCGWRVAWPAPALSPPPAAPVSPSPTLRNRGQSYSYLSNPGLEEEFLDINLTKDSSLLLHAIPKALLLEDFKENHTLIWF
jgi:hypothetical protein